MAFTEAGSTSVLKGFTGKQESAVLAYCYMGLLYGAPTASGSYDECNASDYERTMIGRAGESYTQVMGNPTGGIITNKDFIFFNEAVNGAWSTAERPFTHFGLFRSATLGSNDLYIYGQLTNSVEVPVGYVPLFRKGAFVMTLT